MKTALACFAFLLAFALLGFVVAGWAWAISINGFDGSVSEQTVQPSLAGTVAGVVLGVVFLCIGASLLGGRSQE